MASIEEIPLDIVETVEEIPETVEEIVEAIKEIPKKRGRPAGAKNKKKPIELVDEAPVEEAPVVKAKAKAKVKVKAKAAPKKKLKPVIEDSSSDDDEPPKARAQVMDRQALAAEMLQILSEQRGGRATARREHYATWFQ